jgi:hypothetical protein
MEYNTKDDQPYKIFDSWGHVVLDNVPARHIVKVVSALNEAYHKGYKDGTDDARDRI